MKRKKLFAYFTNNENPNFDKIELSFSCLHFLSGNHRWFCRIWHKDWLQRIRNGKLEFSEAYGENKFQAYRLALKNLQS